MKLKLLIAVLAVLSIGAAFTLAPGANADTSSAGDPNIPSFITVGDVGPYVSVVWRQDLSLKGVNVYRDGAFVKSVSGPGNVFNDPDGNGNSKYQLIGYAGNGNFSEPSVELQAVAAPSTVTFLRWHQKVVQVRWNRPSGARSFEVYMDGQLQGQTADTEFVHKNAVGNGRRFTVVAVYGNGRRSPASLPAGIAPAITTRSKVAVRSGQTQEFSLRLSQDREFRGTMTVDPNTGISMKGNVVDNEGNNLGTFSQTHNGAAVESIGVPTYNPYVAQIQFNPVDGDPAEFAPGSTLEDVAREYPSKPSPTPPPARRGNSGNGSSGNGGSGGGAGDSGDGGSDPKNSSGSDVTESEPGEDRY